MAVSIKDCITTINVTVMDVLITSRLWLFCVYVYVCVLQ